MFYKVHRKPSPCASLATHARSQSLAGRGRGKVSQCISDSVWLSLPLCDGQHDGWIELSDVEGMVAKNGSEKTINDVGKVKIKTCTRKVTRETCRT